MKTYLCQFESKEIYLEIADECGWPMGEDGFPIPTGNIFVNILGKRNSQDVEEGAPPLPLPGYWVQFSGEDDLPAQLMQHVSEDVQNAPIIPGLPPTIVPSAPEPVPLFVTPRQARLALLQAGLLDDVEEALVDAPREARISWEFADIVERNNPLLVGVAQQMGWADQRLDDLFRAAIKL